MKHVAIDLGGRESQICIRAPEGTILEEKRYATKKLEKLMTSWEPSRVIVETSAEAFRIADAAIAAGHEVRVVPATLVRTLGVGARGVKNDKRDAQTLSQVSCQIALPSVHIPSPMARELRSMSGAREALVETRTKLINNVRGWLRTQLWSVRSGTTSTFPARVRNHGVAHERALPTHVERQLLAIDNLNALIKDADKQVQEIASESSVCRKLMTVPGVGTVTAVRFLAAVDDVKRFPRAHLLQSYLGLTPGENSSSDRQRRTGITKAGPAPLRRVLCQAALAAMRTRPADPMVMWASQVAVRRGRFIAIVALARKLVGILFAIWRDGSTYRSTLSAGQVEVSA